MLLLTIVLDDWNFLITVLAIQVILTQITGNLREIEEKKNVDSVE